MTTEPDNSARLTAVVIRSVDLDHDIDVFAAITGATPAPLDGQLVELTEGAVFNLGDAQLALTTGSADHSVRRGIERLVIEVADLDIANTGLRSAGAPIEPNGDSLQINREWAGVHVEVRASTTQDDKRTATVGAVLDHVAILVADVELMTQRWATIVGGPPAHVGVHPLGTSFAGRFTLGDRMIELLAPLPNIESPLQTRLDRFGQGPFALAVIANDLAATVAAVSATGARLIDQSPHVIVHPSDASGVPIQLTPRVHH